MTYLLAIWNSIKVLFTSSTLWKTILAGIGSKAMSIVTNKEVQAYAWQLAVTLRSQEGLSGLQKAAIFNKGMWKFLNEKNLVTTSAAINYVREQACLALAVKEEKNETIEAEVVEVKDLVEEVKAEADKAE